jgi:two-component system sensor histidine kinase EvgS
MSKTIDLKGKRILIVEDDEMNFIYLSQIFRIFQCNIFRAKNGKAALIMAKEENYDVILMDIQLPDINGLEVTKLIRQFDLTTPIIAQTAARSPDETDEAIEAGCTEILIKPYTISDLSSILEKVL